MARRTASVYGPDETLEGVGPIDIIDKCIEDRVIGDSEILPSKMATVESSVAVPFTIVYSLAADATGTLSILASAPFKFEILDVVVLSKNSSGTVTIKSGTSSITDAISTATSGTVTRAGQIIATYSTIAKAGVLAITAGTAADRALVSILAVKVD